MTETVSETSDCYSLSTRLITRENVIAFTHREIFRLCRVSQMSRNLCCNLLLTHSKPVGLDYVGLPIHKGYVMSQKMLEVIPPSL
jgi:hypothetical protein